MSKKNTVSPIDGMDKLKIYINSLDKDERESFSIACGTSLGHLRHIAYAHRPCGESTAINIERESNRVIVCEDLRPDVDWQFIRGTAKHKKKTPTAKKAR